MSLQSMLRDTATLQRATVTKDTSGGSVRATWAVVDSNVKVRVEDLSAAQMLLYLQNDMNVSHNVTTQNGNGRIGDRWLTSDARYLLIQGAMKIRGMGGIPTYYEYAAAEIRPEA